MKVLKFGTSALATSQKFNQSVRLAGSTKDSIVVLSALAGTTEKLEEISEYLYKKNPEGANECINSFEQEYKQIISELFASEQYKSEAINFVKDRIAYIRSFSKDLFTLFEEKIVLAQGEILSSGLFTLKLKESGVNVKEIPALDFMRIDKKNEPDTSYIEENLNRLLSENKDADLYVTQGYICRNAYGEIDNFDFGGSDYTAALTGAAVGAGEIQIWTDVDVLYGKNSNLISNSQTVRHINFDEAAELAYFGAKILHPRCILPAKLGNIPVRLLSLDATGSEGTLI
ncbi:MAG TPA: aspartate kinase, partial [Dysgonomonas sp.]|nr:aspartate kinase [Dysgonomonas sp.]